MSHARPAVPTHRSWRLVVLVTASSVVCSVLAGFATWWVIDDDGASGTLARATGITAYLLLVCLVLLGLLLSHPRRSTWRRPQPTVRVRAHVSLAVFTLVFTALHLVLWATSARGRVGWLGAVVPFASSYRTVFVAFGVLGLWAGLAAGVTASLAGHAARRVWWPVHKVAIGALVLVWAHVLGGADARRLLGVYVVTGAVIAAVALSRYVLRPPRAAVAELAVVPARELEAAGLRTTRSGSRLGA